MNISKNPPIPVLTSINDPDLYGEIQTGVRTMSEKLKLIPTPSLVDALDFLGEQSESARLLILDSRVLLADYTGFMDKYESSSIEVPVLLLVWPEHADAVRPARHAGVTEWLVIDSDGVYASILPEVLAKILDTPRNEGRAVAVDHLLDLRDADFDKREENGKHLVEQADGSVVTTDIMAMMSHEIRTPMNSIIGYTQLLQRTSLDAPQNECARVIKSNGQHLLELIDDILDFSKLESGKLGLQDKSFELEELIRETESSLALVAEAKNLQIKTNIDSFIPRYIEADRTRIKQVLTNLLHNAIKYTENGEVTVEAHAEPVKKTSQWKVRLTVRDSGAGIAPECQEHLFEPFSQFDMPDFQGRRGAGLGLAICRRLAELMGGACWVESALGKGATFHFTFPAEERFAASEVEDESPSGLIDPDLGDNCPLRILIAEDDDNNRKLLKAFLELLGYHNISTVTNGCDALEKLRHHQFDIVLMDIQLPGMNGVEVTRRVRRGEAGAAANKSRIVAITAYAMPGDEEAFLQAGMNDYLSKPLDFRKLQDVLREAAVAVDAA